MSASADRPWWLDGRVLAVGGGTALVVAYLRQHMHTWAPFNAELEMWRILFRAGWKRVITPSDDDGTSSLSLSQRLERVQELRAILQIERNHQIDLAKNGPPEHGKGWGETTGVHHMRHLPGLVFRGKDQQRAADVLAKMLSLPEVKKQVVGLMREKMDTPVMKDLVLIGGGHSHAHVLRMLGMEPQPGVRVTLITRDVETPYSGMLPGHVAGLYTREECHIDLNMLARFAQVRLVHETAVGLDLQNKRVLLKSDRPPIAYDVLSINIGSAPRLQSSMDTQNVVPVKPIDSFGARWDTLLEQAPSWQGQQRVLIVGGGAGGVELAFAMKARLDKEVEKYGNKAQVSVSLVTRSKPLSQHTHGVRAIAMKAMRERGIQYHDGCDVTGAKDGHVKSADGRSFPFEHCIWCTAGAPQAWIGECGLATDPHGFLCVDQNMRCRVTAPGVDGGVIFAGGDIATVDGFDRPKAGVFAVMGGFALSINIRATLLGEPMLSYYPQKSSLSLLGLGDGSCIASRGTLATEGEWLWKLKDWIDRRWMWDYHGGLPEMPQPATGSTGGAIAAAAGPDALALLQHATMRCGGCGAKVGATTLSQAMARVEIPSQPSAESGAHVVIGVGDDAAVVEQFVKNNTKGSDDNVALVQTIDYFRSFIDDPYVFGRIATIHALSDCEAMGAVPQTALALVQMPYAMEGKTEEDLVQLMSGAASALKDIGCALVGGHTCEAKEMGLGMAVVGRMPGGAAEVLRKDALKQGDVLVLTKPIGTGTLFAADMRAKARGRWIIPALKSMATSNGPAASILRSHGALACTDITGFGLVGHLLEMCRGSKAFVSINLRKVPFYEGALDCLAMGITSSLQPANTRLRRAVANHDEVCHDSAYPLVFDPQTSGGLVGALPKARAEACVKELRASGAAPFAVVIGEVSGPAPENASADAGHITIQLA